MKLFADLHNHTRSSDGDLTAQALVRAAKEKGLGAIGVTDHDTLAGLDAALAQGQSHGVAVVPGVEISVRFNRSFFTGTLHVLAYFSPERLTDTAFVSGFEALLSQGRGKGLVRARIERINKVFGPGGTQPVLHRPMAYEDISVYAANASRRHFALALSEKFNIRNKDDITRIIGNSSPAYLPSGVPLEGVKQFLSQAPVVAVLAHPAAGSFPGEGHYKEVLPPLETVETLLPEFLDAGVAGLEVFYPGHAPAHEKLLLAWADQYGLLVTGGSDCHDTSERPPGVAGIDKIRYAALEQAIQSKNEHV
jgi:predicted metal-dependent phosphoesterase TrpH